jgi:hypothetical protein
MKTDRNTAHNRFKMPYEPTFSPCTSLGTCPVGRVWRVRALAGPVRPGPGRLPPSPCGPSAGCPAHAYSFPIHPAHHCNGWFQQSNLFTKYVHFMPSGAKIKWLDPDPFYKPEQTEGKEKCGSGPRTLANSSVLAFDFKTNISVPVLEKVTGI